MDWIKIRFQVEDIHNCVSCAYIIICIYSLYIYIYNTMLYEGYYVDSLLLMIEGYVFYLGDVFKYFNCIRLHLKNASL